MISSEHAGGRFVQINADPDPFAFGRAIKRINPHHQLTITAH